MIQVDRFMNLFLGLTRAYGTYVVDADRSDGKKIGKATTLQEPVTREVWHRHLVGQVSVGVIPINDDSKCRFGAIDIDVYRGLKPLEIIQKLNRYKIPFVLCRSKSGGVHVYCFTSEYVDASLMQRKLKEVSAGLGFGSSEIFPKQTKILAERGDIGGWINMPYFGGAESTRYGYDDSGNALSADMFLAIAETKRLTEDQLIAVHIPKEIELKDGPPCLESLISDKFQEGTRNNGLFNLGVYLRKAHPDRWEHLLEEYNVKFLEPPLPSKEIVELKKSLKKKTYQYTCSTAPICNHCDLAVCKSRRHGVGTSLNMPSLHSLTKYDTDPPIWFLDVDSGGRIELTTEELQNQRKFQKRCMECLNIMPAKLTDIEWSKILNTLLEKLNVIDVPVDASPEGLLLEMIEKFCTGKVRANEKDEMLLGKPWFDPEARCFYFRMNDLLAFLNRHNFRDYKSNKISSIMRRHGGSHKQFNIKGKGVNCWSMPPYTAIESNFAIPRELTEDAKNPF